jgi:hypothetical protein
MKSFLFVLLFVGIILIIDGVYRNEIEHLKTKKNIEYKFIPKMSYIDIYNNGKNNHEVISDLFTSEIDTRSGKIKLD